MLKNNRLFRVKIAFIAVIMILVTRMIHSWYYTSVNSMDDFYYNEAIALGIGSDLLSVDSVLRPVDDSAEATSYNTSRRSSNYAEHIHRLVVADYLKQRENWSTSELGTLLFKNPDRFNNQIKLMTDLRKQQSVHFKILIWKVGKSLEGRHVYYYGSERKDVFKDCEVQNCKITYDATAISTADAVLIHLHKGLIPGMALQKQRTPRQRWIFLTDESPEHTFINRPQDSWTGYSGIFNWSMSYRADSDIPVPYGRTVALKTPLADDLSNSGLKKLIPNWPRKRRDVLVAILISNCSSKRMKFIKELMQFVKVEIFGDCSSTEEKRNACPGHFREDCPAVNDFMFYLAFENSRCYQYITEKVFFNAYTKGAIPVIIGSDIDSVREILPPFSFVYSDNFTHAAFLANYLKDIGQDEDRILSFHHWRRHFEVVNEHGYFKTPSLHYCRLCQALNYNSNKVSVYDIDKLAMFLDAKVLCIKKN